ncbi:MAG: hypothetical protein VYA34_12640 [Myxococcota bacterium]|nr:hypothetical protein [Myxococcota bacterium]
MNALTPLWSEIERADIIEVLTDRWNDHMNDDENFSIAADALGTEVVVRLDLGDVKADYLYKIEVGIDHDRFSLSRSEALDVLLNVIDVYLEDYLTEGRRSNLPINWRPSEYDRMEIQIRGELLRPRLEAMADEWLERGNTMH